MQRAYCDTLEEAGEIATEYENGYDMMAGEEVEE